MVCVEFEYGFEGVYCFMRFLLMLEVGGELELGFGVCFRCGLVELGKFYL